jgi:hypothetical protein
MGEQDESETACTEYRVPIFSVHEDMVSCRLNAGWIERGIEESGATLSDDERAMFAFLHQRADANSFSLPLNRGDILFCNNYTVLHGRAGHQEVVEEERKRLLLRVWLDLPDVRRFTDEPRVRYGVIRHGRLGWSAADVLAGRHLGQHRRRPDGAPAIGA